MDIGHMTRALAGALVLAASLAACPTPASVPEPAEPTPIAEPAPAAEPAASAAPARETPFVRRPFAAEHDGKPIIAGISYGPFREGQAPGGPSPTAEQILEDLKLLAPDWHMIRVYSSRGPTEDILKVIRDNQLPIGVMVGAWIAPHADEANRAEVDGVIRLANAYPEQVIAVSIGNESQVAWSGHRTPPDVLIRHIREARAGLTQPVTTADDYNFWNKPESHAVADEIDFLLLHAYAMWNKQTLDDAVSWTATTVASIQKEHPELKIVMGETGWATVLNEEAGPDNDQIKQIVGAAGEAEQARFFKEFTAWAQEAGQPYFYFEAFDEPWKGGSDNPTEIEKNWGIYGVDRQPKQAVKAAP